MEKEFIPYEQALALKELGFDEPCLGFYDGKGDTTLYFNNLRNASGDFEPFNNNKRLTWFGVPLYQQSFRWFREKYDLVSWVRRRPGFVKEYSWYVSDFNDEDPDEYYFDLHIETYEEAELACLNKLIEIALKK